MKKKFLFTSILATIVIVGFTQICQAQQLKIINPFVGISTVWELLDLIFRWLFWISVPITVGMILIAAITLITSSGEKEKLKKAKDTIIYALLGFSVVILANGIPPLIMQIISSGQEKEKIELPVPTDLAACHTKCDKLYTLGTTKNGLCRSDCSKSIEPPDPETTECDKSYCPSCDTAICLDGCGESSFSCSERCTIYCY